jgi:hypothetical protein
MPAAGVAVPAGGAQASGCTTQCHQDKQQPKNVMTEAGSLRVLLNLTPGRPTVFQDQPGVLLPNQQMLSTSGARCLRPAPELGLWEVITEEQAPALAQVLRGKGLG